LRHSQFGAVGEWIVRRFARGPAAIANDLSKGDHARIGSGLVV